MGTSFYERGRLSSPPFDLTGDQSRNDRHRRSLISSSEREQRKNCRLSSPSFDLTGDQSRNDRHRRSSILSSEREQRKNCRLSSPSIDLKSDHSKNDRHRRYSMSSSGREQRKNCRLSSPSIDLKSDHSRNDRHRRYSMSSSGREQRKNSRMTRRRRHSEKVDEICNSTVQDSLMKFLNDSQDEDFEFSKANIDEGSLDDEEFRKLFRIDNSSDHRGKRSSKTSRSKSGRISNRTDSRHKGSSRGRKKKKPKKSKSTEQQREEKRDTSSSIPSVGSEIANQATLHSSLSDLKSSRFRTDNLTGSLRSRSLTSDRLKSRTRDRSGLMVGLESLDRQVRRGRMKKEYRCRSGLGDSFSSGMSFRSQHTEQTYKKNGLEGGALNAYMSNDNITRQVCRGGDITSLSESATSFFSAPASEEYLKERKTRQDHIIDLARREKWLQAVKNEEEEKQRKNEEEEKQRKKDEIESILQFSDDEPERKKEWLVDKLKRAANKTTKISKSSVKGAANAVVNSKLTLKNSYTAVDQDEGKTEKLIGDWDKGSIMGSIIVVDAKGGLETRRSLAKKRSNAIGKEEGDGNSRVMSNSPRPRDEKKKKKHGSRSVSNSPRSGQGRKKHSSRSISNSPRSGHGRKKHSSRSITNSPRSEHGRKKHSSRSISNSPRSGHGRKKQSSRSISNSPGIKDNKVPGSRLNFDKIRERCGENLKSPDAGNVYHRTSGNISFNRSPFSNSASEIPFPILTDDPFPAKFDCDWWAI